MPGMKNKNRYRVISVCLTGPYHKQKGIRCQDYAVCVQKDKRIIAVVSDGAGSAKYGYLGAKYVCKTLCQNLLAIRTKDIRQCVVDALEATRDELICHRLNKSKNEAGLIDFAATVVGMIYDGKGGLFFHIGDGAAIALPRQDTKKIIISEPENGIFSSETFFFTMDDWRDSLRFIPFEKSRSAFLMTDGVTGFALKRNMRELETGFVSPINTFLENEKNTKRATKALKNTLETPKASKLAGDDKTLMWIKLS